MKRLYIFNDRRIFLFICYILLRIIFEIAENPFVEDNSHENADSNASIGELEDGGEEIGAAPQREFFRNQEELEVEHIDHLAEKERRVAVTWRPLGHLQEVALGE